MYWNRCSFMLNDLGYEWSIGVMSVSDIKILNIYLEKLRSVVVMVVIVIVVVVVVVVVESNSPVRVNTKRNNPFFNE